MDDRLIERCYGLLQGRSKGRVAREDPNCFAQIHRGYELAPHKGKSLRMVEKRMLSFLEQFKDWLGQNPGNVAISCHGNSMRPIRRVFEHLSLKQMLQLENPQNRAMVYDLHQRMGIESPKGRATKPDWKSIVISPQVKLATDPLNALKIYYY
jgi:2,3-bisphosphoglycerate-dependent phosphoglycerate mutase